MAPKDKIQFEGTVPAAEAAQYLESLARGLRERSMLLESGDSSVTLEVTDDVKIEIEVASGGEKGKSSLELSVSWRQQRQDDVVPPAGLLIVPGATPAETTSFVE